VLDTLARNMRVTRTEEEGRKKRTENNRGSGVQYYAPIMSK
jgi:hypothetical protein